MRPMGWKYESARHGLAARGIKTRYVAGKYMHKDYYADIGAAEAAALGDVEKQEENAQKRRNNQRRGRTTLDAEGKLTPGTALARLVKQRQLQRVEEEVIREQRPDQKAISLIKNDQFDGVVSIDGKKYTLQQLLASNKLSAVERGAIENQLRIEAVRLTNAKIVLPPLVQAAVAKDPETQRQLEAIRTAQKRAGEGAFKQTARVAGEEALVGLAESPAVLAQGAGGIAGAAGGTVAQGFAGAGQSDQEFTGLLGGLDEAKQSPFFKTNALIGNEEDHAFAPTNVAEKQGGSLGQVFEQFSQGSFGGSKKPTHIERSSKEVESLYDARDDFAKVDLSAFECGNKAFDSGDREELIDAITRLEAEEEKLKDRYYLMEQTRAEVLNPRNRVSAYHEDEGNGFSNPLFGGGSGAQRLAESTQKYNEVKAAIKKSNNEVYARRVMLRRKLARLDAGIPPESGAPEHVKVFDQKSGNSVEGFAQSVQHPGGVVRDFLGGK